MLPWLFAGMLLADQGLEKIQIIQGTSGARSANLELHAGGLVVREDQVGAIFGTVRVGKTNPQFSYFVLLKHRCTAETPMEWSEETTAEGDSASSKQLLTMDGNSLVVEYQLNLETSNGPRRGLTVNKKSIEESKGRVLLVDMTVNPPRWEQRKVDLPNDLGDTMSKKSAEELVRKTVQSMTQKDARIKEFVNSAGR